VDAIVRMIFFNNKRKENMTHTKQTDKAALKRVVTLGTRSINPEDFAHLERIARRLEEKIEARHKDEEEDISSANAQDHV
jgi:hypothetical protein